MANRGSVSGSFSVSSRTLPGLSKVIEEAGEALHVAGKLHGDPHNDRLRAHLWEELGDLLAAVEFLAENENATQIVHARKTRKLQRHRKRRKRTVDDPDTVAV